MTLPLPDVPAAPGGVPVQEPGQMAADPAQDVAHRAVVRQPLLGRHPPAQVHHGEGGVRQRDVHPADGVVGGVDVHRHLGAAGPWRTVRRRQLAQQPEPDQLGRVPGDGGRAQPGVPRQRGPGHRTAPQHGPQHRPGGAALAAAAGGRRGHGRQGDEPWRAVGGGHAPMLAGGARRVNGPALRPYGSPANAVCHTLPRPIAAP
ncbi:hypothetical protein C8250_031460 [Streptomyces sp. So13.3]|uniref:hypothetical protein n=1 Tax=Streptomyces TaxID=1883 RepID=UPI001106E6F2|nr:MULTISPECIES: hypothetical protein [Streptomyces]MCZ4095590.1 hypothetical protein [Streptomyces sp. H39-C1]QNA75805.1 hypothetical protein C8250_031460 [Streptomyces sp. So13.3]